MSESLQDIIKKKSNQQPPEIAAVKLFVKDRFKVEPGVSVSKDSITILVPNSAVAGSLRMVLFELSEALVTDKKLIIRIGQNSI